MMEMMYAQRSFVCHFSLTSSARILEAAELEGLMSYVCATIGMISWDLGEERARQGVYFGSYVNHEHTRLGKNLGKDIIDTLGYF